MAGSSVTVMGVRIAGLNRERALRAVAWLIERNRPSILAFANAHTLNLAHDDAKYRQVLCDADLVLRDGIGVGLAGYMRGAPFPENLNGSDFVPDILALCARMGHSVFLLGGRVGVAEAAAEHFAVDHPTLDIVGTSHGMFRIAEESRIVEQIRASGADVLLVALGNPLQEQFLARHLPLLGVRLGVGVGAFFDFSVGAVRRAPALANRLGIEWVFRLAREPRRLWRRYLVGNPLFLVRCIGHLRSDRQQIRRLHEPGSV